MVIIARFRRMRHFLHIQRKNQYFYYEKNKPMKCFEYFNSSIKKNARVSISALINFSVMESIEEKHRSAVLFFLVSLIYRLCSHSLRHSQCNAHWLCVYCIACIAFWSELCGKQEELFPFLMLQNGNSLNISIWTRKRRNWMKRKWKRKKNIRRDKRIRVFNAEREWCMIQQLYGNYTVTCESCVVDAVRTRRGNGRWRARDR